MQNTMVEVHTEWADRITSEHVAGAKLPSEISAIRRDNVRLLKERYGGKRLAEMLGLAQSSFISQMAGPKPSRDVTEKTVRTLEKELSLHPGSLDIAYGACAEKPMSADENITMVAAAVRTIGNICGAEGVELPTNKLTEIIALALVDAMEHGGTLREGHIRQVVRLLK